MTKEETGSKINANMGREKEEYTGFPLREALKSCKSAVEIPWKVAFEPWGAKA